MGKKSVVLFSGGLDSTTVLAMAQSRGDEVYTLTFDYGQRHSVEVERAGRLAKEMGVKNHKVAHIDLRIFGGSSLTDDLEVAKHRKTEEMASGIPLTYVPARNTIFLSYALAYAEVLEADFIYIGVNALDYSGYPDCRPEYIQAFQTMADLAIKRAVEGRRVQIETPILMMSKKEIILAGLKLGVDYGKTHSCYDPDPEGRACGGCDSCLLRKKAFEEAGIPDPTPYA